MVSGRKIEQVLAEIDEHLAVMRENLEEERIQRAIEANRYHGTMDWDYDPDPMEI